MKRISNKEQGFEKFGDTSQRKTKLTSSNFSNRNFLSDSCLLARQIRYLIFF